MVVREWPKEAKELTWMELDQREWEGWQGAVEPGCNPATIAAEKMDNNAITVDILQVRQQPKLVEEEWM